MKNTEKNVGKYNKSELTSKGRHAEKKIKKTC